jgi:hypothetical protein
MNNILAQIFGTLATLSNVIGIQLKTKEKILVFYILACMFFVINFTLLMAYSGTATCAIMGIITTIMYFMDKYKKEVKTHVIVTMIIFSVGISSLFYSSLVDLISISSCIPFVLMSVQKKEKYVRLWTGIFLLFYATFDILVGAYTAFVGDLCFLVSTLISVIRYDLLTRIHK